MQSCVICCCGNSCQHQNTLIDTEEDKYVYDIRSKSGVNGCHWQIEWCHG